MPLFELDEGPHRKFYRIERVGRRIELHWGRIGTLGQRKTLELATEAETDREYDAEVSRRKERGYSQVHDEEQPRNADEARQRDLERKTGAVHRSGRRPRRTGVVGPTPRVPPADAGARIRACRGSRARQVARESVTSARAALARLELGAELSPRRREPRAGAARARDRVAVGSRHRGGRYVDRVGPRPPARPPADPQ